jgi:hypothetical protein
VASFDSANAGTRTASIDSVSLSNGTNGFASNYSLASGDIAFTSDTATIAQKALTYSGTPVAQDKMYDGTRVASATVDVNDFTGILSGDDLGTLVATFDTKDADLNKVVTLSFTGGDSANYSLPTITTLADITPAQLTATVAANDRFYDSTNVAIFDVDTVSGYINNETLTVAIAGVFDSAEAGSRTATVQ